MTTDNNALDQAKAQADSITAMVAALNVDYDRLEELRDELESLEDNFKDADSDEEKAEAFETLSQWRMEHAEELKELEHVAGDCKDADEAREAIQNDPLSVQVRSDWVCASDEMKPSEFNILLCTGGPAVRIIGELNEHMEPCRAWIEYQDWGTPWTHAVSIINQSVLLEYCQQFYFGE